MSPILGTLASQFSGKPFTNFESISTVTVGSGGASDITFSSIPQGYAHLQIRGIGRTNAAGFNTDIVTMQFNNDTATNYSYHFIYGDSSSVYSGALTTQNSIFNYYTSAADTTANTFGAFIIDILDYADTNKYKTTKTLSGMEQNTSYSLLFFSSGNWRNTNAITSIKLTPYNGSFIQYTKFALYGIRD